MRHPERQPRAHHARRVALALGVLTSLACSDVSGPTSHPAPVLESIGPGVIMSGGPPTTLIVSGEGFVEESRVHIDGAERPTTVSDSTQLSTELSRDDLAVSGEIEVAAVNPAPGGGRSDVLEVTIVNPVPSADTVFPAQVAAGSPDTTLLVHGSSFRPNTVVRWDGADRPTDVLSAHRLEVALGAGDVAEAARVDLGVHNPGPRGGLSELEYVVHDPTPRVDSIEPADAVAGRSDLTLTVFGQGFDREAVVRWNGSPRETTWLAPNHLSTVIPGEDLADAGDVDVTVANPDPSLDVSNVRTFTIRRPERLVLDLHAVELAWDSERELLYASLLDTDPRFPEEVVALDPQTGDVVGRVVVGDNPSRLAIADDASVLYVALDGEAAIARVDLATLTVDLTFDVGTAPSGTLFADDIQVMPGEPGTVAVSRMNPDWRPRNEGVALYDEGVPRPTATEPREGGNVIQFASEGVLYGHYHEGSSFDLFQMEVTDTGLEVRDELTRVVHSFHADMRYGHGYLFFSPGSVIDAEKMWPAATLEVTGLVAPEPRGGRVYYLTGETLRAFSTETWTLIDSQVLHEPPPALRGLVRWGSNGFAFVSSGQVMIFRSDLALQ